MRAGPPFLPLVASHFTRYLSCRSFASPCLKPSHHLMVAGRSAMGRSLVMSMGTKKYIVGARLRWPQAALFPGNMADSLEGFCHNPQTALFSDAPRSCTKPSRFSSGNGKCVAHSQTPGKAHPLESLDNSKPRVIVPCILASGRTLCTSLSLFFLEDTATAVRREISEDNKDCGPTKSALSGCPLRCLEKRR